MWQSNARNDAIKVRWPEFNLQKVSCWLYTVWRFIMSPVTTKSCFTTDHGKREANQIHSWRLCSTRKLLSLLHYQTTCQGFRELIVDCQEDGNRCECRYESHGSLPTFACIAAVLTSATEKNYYVNFLHKIFEVNFAQCISWIITQRRRKK